jgi:prepilin-type N-terminal cleavage/methylation domain-containing protein
MILSLMNKKKAFTLIELLVAVSVMLVLMLVGIGSYNTYDNRNTLNLSGDSLVGFINDAQEIAKSRALDVGTTDKEASDKLIIRWIESERNFVCRWYISGNELADNYASYHVDNKVIVSSVPEIAFSAGSGNLLTDRTVKITSKGNSNDYIEIKVTNDSTTTTSSF